MIIHRVTIRHDSFTYFPLHRHLWLCIDLWRQVRAAGSIEFWDAGLADRESHQTPVIVNLFILLPANCLDVVLFGLEFWRLLLIGLYCLAIWLASVIRCWLHFEEHVLLVTNFVDSLEDGLLLLNQLLGLQCLLVILTLLRLDHGHIRCLQHHLVHIFSVVGVDHWCTTLSIGCRRECCHRSLLLLLLLLLNLLLWIEVLYDAWVALGRVILALFNWSTRCAIVRIVIVTNQLIIVRLNWIEGHYWSLTVAPIAQWALAVQVCRRDWL